MHHIALAICHSFRESDTIRLEKRAIPTVLEFDEIFMGC